MTHRPEIPLSNMIVKAAQCEGLREKETVYHIKNIILCPSKQTIVDTIISTQIV